MKTSIQVSGSTPLSRSELKECKGAQAHLLRWICAISGTCFSSSIACAVWCSEPEQNSDCIRVSSC